MDREQPRAPPPNDQNDGVLLKKILPGAVTVLGGDGLVRCQNHCLGLAGLESSRRWVVMTPRGCVSASSVERAQTGSRARTIQAVEELSRPVLTSLADNTVLVGLLLQPF